MTNESPLSTLIQGVIHVRYAEAQIRDEGQFTAIAELVQDWASTAGSELIQLLVGSAPMMEPAYQEVEDDSD